MAGARIQLKRGTAANWTAANTVLFSGEIGYETDTKKFKVGDGSTAWNALTYTFAPLALSTLNDLGDVTISSAADGDFLRWNGTAWINDAVNLSTDTIGSYVQNLVAGTGVSLTDNSGEGATPTIAIGQSVGTGDSPTFVNVTASLTGNASTATTLQTSRNIAGQAFNGSANISIAPTDLTGVTSTAAEINILDGATLSTAELNFVDGVTSAIQTQIDTNASNASTALSNHESDTTNIHGIADTSILVTTTGSQTLTNKTITTPSGLVKGDVGLGNVDNTSDANKPVSTATQTALDLKANLASPTFTGTPTLPTGTIATTQTAGDNTTALATTAFVSTAVSNLVDSAPATLNTLNELADALGDDPSFATTVSNSIGLKAPIESPTFTGTVSGITSTMVGLGNVDNTSDANKPVSTATQTELDLKAPLASPTFTGTVTVPDNSFALGTKTTGNYIASTDAVDGMHVRYIPFADVASYVGEYNNGANYANGAIVSTGVGSPYGTSGQLFIRVSNPGNPGYPPGNAAWAVYSHQASPSEGCLAVFAVDDTIMQVKVTDVSDTEISYLNGVTSAIQTQIDTKAPLASPTFTGTVTLPDNTVALGSKTTGDYVTSLVAGTGVTLTNNSGESATPTIAVDTAVIQARVADVSDTEIGYLNGVTSGIQTQIDTKAPLASPTFTGTVSGITSTMVGLGNVDNTSDANKPVSTAQQTALDLKAPLASPTFTGTVTLPSGTVTSAMILDGTIANEDISSSAAIEDTKLATISTASKVSNSATTATSANTASAIVARDASGNFTAGTVTASLTGNASTATTLQTSRTIELTGDVTGSASFDGSANASITATIAANSVALGADTTGDYVATITGGTGVSSTAATSGEGTTHTLSIGQAVGTTDNVTFAGVTADNIKVGVTGANEIDTVSGDLTIDSAGGTVTVDDNLTVTGNLTVSGTTTSINTETLTVDDNIIVLNNNATGAPSANAGIEIERGSSTNVELRWNETSDKWELTEDGTIYSDIATVSYVDAQSIAALDDIGNVTAPTPTSGDFLKWNGSAWVNDPINLGTDTTGDYTASLVAGTGITLANNSGEGATPTVTVDTTVIAPLASPTFTGTVTVPTPTNGTDAVTKTYTDAIVTAARIITAAGGDGTNGQALTTNGSGTLDFTTITGTTEASIISAVGGDGAAGSVLKTNGSGDLSFGDVALGTNTTGNYVSGVSQGTGISVTHTPGEGSTATVALNATLDDLSNVSVASPTDGHFLKYHNASSSWVSAAVPTINTLDDVGDVTITSAASGQFLKWTGSAWVNDAIDLGTDTTGNYMTNVTAGDGITVTHTAGEGSTATISARDTLVRFYMEVI